MTDQEKARIYVKIEKKRKEKRKNNILQVYFAMAGFSIYIWIENDISRWFILLLWIVGIIAIKVYKEIDYSIGESEAEAEIKKKILEEREKQKKAEEEAQRLFEIEKRKAEEERLRLLSIEELISKKTTIPIEEGSLMAEDEDFAMQMLSLIDKCEIIQTKLRTKVSNGETLLKAEKVENRNSLLGLSDAKLCLLYGISLKRLCNNLEVPYEPYHSALESAINKSNSLPMRTDDDELDILNRIPTHQLRELEELSRFAIGNNIHSYLGELEQISRRDTSGFLGESLELVEAKTSDMNNVVNKIYSDVESVKQWCININQVLNIARVEAFRNQYLGFELFNIISRESEGSENLIEQSMINIDQLDIPNLSFSIEDFKLSLGDVAGKFIEVMGAMSELNIKSGKGQAAAAVAGAAMALVAARNEKIEQNLSQQNAYLKYAKSVLPKLSGTIAQRKQAIDVIRSIVAANDGFMSVYIPLRNEIFVEKKAPKQIENIVERLHELKFAVDQYYQISNKKI